MLVGGAEHMNTIQIHFDIRPREAAFIGDSDDVVIELDIRFETDSLWFL